MFNRSPMVSRKLHTGEICYVVDFNYYSKSFALFTKNKEIVWKNKGIARKNKRIVRKNKRIVHDNTSMTTHIIIKQISAKTIKKEPNL